MGFEFKSDQPEQSLPAVSTTTLSFNGTTTNTAIGYPPNATITETDLTTTSGSDETMDLVQPIFSAGEEEKLAIQFIEENELYVKFMLWCGIQDQLKNIKDSLTTTAE